MTQPETSMYLLTARGLGLEYLVSTVLQVLPLQHRNPCCWSISACLERA